MITITIPGDPIPQKRHATYHRGDQCCAYDPQKKDKERVRAYLPRQRPFPDGTALGVSIKFFIIPCQSSTKQQLEDKLNGKLHPTAGDIDNFLKFYLDCGNGLLWDDDRHIISVVATKCYDAVPCTQIIVQECVICI